MKKKIVEKAVKKVVKQKSIQDFDDLVETMKEENMLYPKDSVGSILGDLLDLLEIGAVAKEELKKRLNNL